MRPHFYNRLFYSLTRALIVLLTMHTPALAQKTGKPNFILYITDDIGQSDLGCFGNTAISTPNIDQLAKNGLRFDNAYVTASSCSPSRCSLITGRYPHNTGAPELHEPLPPGQVLFPKLLKEAGYYTVLSGKQHMGPEVLPAFDLVSKGRGPGLQEDWVDILKNAPADKPFFFWFASSDAHRDWQFSDHVKKYLPADIKVPPTLYDGPLTREDLAGYYHEISRADYHMGLLVKALEEKGILNNTYIIFMSDNGRPFPRDKTRLYDSGVKTPLIISGPMVKKGLSHSLISSIDLAPTILELAGVKPSPAMQGVPIVNVLKKPAALVRDFIFTEHNWHVYQAHERMVRYKDWVYIRNAFPDRQSLSMESNAYFPAGKELWEAEAKGLTAAGQKDVFLIPRPAEELYYLPDDPMQFKNVAAEPGNAKTIAYLRKILDTWIADTGDSVPANPTKDNVNVAGQKLGGQWKRGENAGDSKNAQRINHAGPVRYTGGL